MPTGLPTPPYGERMATFSQKSVMGTLFETTERLEKTKAADIWARSCMLRLYEPATQNGNLLDLGYLGLSGIISWSSSITSQN